jgi:hypothetical protein
LAGEEARLEVIGQLSKKEVRHNVAKQKPNENWYNTGYRAASNLIHQIRNRASAGFLLMFQLMFEMKSPVSKLQLKPACALGAYHNSYSLEVIIVA